MLEFLFSAGRCYQRWSAHLYAAGREVAGDVGEAEGLRAAVWRPAQLLGNPCNDVFVRPWHRALVSNELGDDLPNQYRRPDGVGDVVVGTEWWQGGVLARLGALRCPALAPAWRPC